MPPRIQQRNIPTLDGWRAVAVLMVTAFHASKSIWGGRQDVIYVSQFGALGVDVFFALSGLLITKLLLEEQDRTGDVDLTAFYVRRCFRVALPCYFYLAVLYAFSFIPHRLELASGLLFFRNYLSADYPGPYTVHLWSIAVEEHFYLLWPPIFVLAGSKQGRQVAMWLGVAFGLWRIVCTHYFPSLAGFAYAQFRTDFRIDTLLWGCVVAFVLHQAHSHAKRYLTPLVWTALLAAYLLCLLFYSPLTRLWMPMLMPLLIAGTATHSNWRLSRILDAQPVRWIGRLSYSLYLWQLVFLDTSHSLEAGRSPSWWQQFPENLLLVFLAAVVSYYFVESPLRQLGRGLSDAISRRKAEAISDLPVSLVRS
jgi:peptidoglycan/LPS O-acetylase OafA/YrhL